MVQADGKILVGGNFTLIGGQTRNNIARLDPATGLADSFDPNANQAVDSIVAQANGRILVGGDFRTIGGQVRQSIARLDATTGLADPFDPNVGMPLGLEEARTERSVALPSTPLTTPTPPPVHVSSIAVQRDGKILVGGDFTSIGGQNRKLFARLTNDTAALQNLAVTPATVTWTRGGSSPLLGRVTFESSTDNVNYNSLGNATAAGSNWILTGLNLPTGQNIYIRARGYYGTGEGNVSGSITEAVRNAFIAPPPAPTQVASRKMHNGAPFDINLPFTGNSGIECRSGGATNDYSVVFTFPDPVTFSAAFVSGTGSVNSTTGSGTTTVTVNLTGVTNAQTIGVTLFGVNNGMSTSDVSVPMGVLVGDSNGDRFVNAGDALQTRNRSGQATAAANFRSDVNTDGFINSGDTLVVRGRSGTSLGAVGGEFRHATLPGSAGIINFGDAVR